MTILSRLFAPRPEPTCPGCGRAFATWWDTYVHDGYNIVRWWTGCPEYERAPFADRERHYARWRRGDRTPLVDC